MHPITQRNLQELGHNRYSACAVDSAEVCTRKGAATLLQLRMPLARTVPYILYTMASNPASCLLTNPNATRQKRNVAFNDRHSPRFALPLH
jgi:hypothetical protein